MESNIQLYNRIMKNFDEAVQKLIKYTTRYEISELQKQIENIQAVVQRDSFEIIVVGEFSNGKSTFINALLRDDFLPSSINPTTAILNKISYAPSKTYTIVYRDGKRKQMDESAFRDIVAPDAHPSLIGNLFGIDKAKQHIQTIREAELGFPTEFCKNNITLIDSPGTNDFDAAREAITTHYIPKSDAAIFLLNATKPFSESDKVFLERILDEHLHKIFFLVNFKDLLNSEVDEQTAVTYIKEQLAHLIENPKVFLISAQHALLNHRKAAGAPEKRRRKPILPLEQTGMPQFEQELDLFLAYGTGLEKLTKVWTMYTSLTESLINEHLLYEKSMLQNASKKTQQEIHSLGNKLEHLEYEMQAKLIRSTNEISLYVEQLKNWYHQELMTISSIALQTLDEASAKTSDQGVIKQKIERKTGKLESQLPQKTAKKIEEKINRLFKNDYEHFHAQLQELKQDISSLKTVESYSWQREIPTYEEKERSYGFFGSIFSAVRDFFTGSHRKVDVQAKMREQVLERYSAQIPTLVSNFEKTVSYSLSNIIEQMNLKIKRQIQDERKRNMRAMQMHTSEQQEVQQKLNTIEQDIREIQLLEKEVERYLQQYMKQEVM